MRVITHLTACYHELTCHRDFIDLAERPIDVTPDTDEPSVSDSTCALPRLAPVRTAGLLNQWQTKRSCAGLAGRRT